MGSESSTISFWRGWYTRVAGGAFRRNVAKVAGGTAAGQLAVIAVSPILTRIYAPEHFGILGVYSSLFLILLVISTLRYDAAIPVPESEEDAFHLLILSILSVMGVSAVLALGIYEFGGAIAAGMQTPSLAQFLWLLPVGVCGAGINKALNGYAVRAKAYSSIAKTKVGQALSQAGSQVGLGLLSTGPLGLILGDVIGRSAGSGTLYKCLRQRLLEAGRAFRWSCVASVARRYKKFALLSAPSALLNSAGYQVAPILFVVGYGPEVGGWFSFTLRIINLPVGLIGQSVAQVYSGEIAGLIRSSPSGARNLFDRTAKRLLVISLGPCILLLTCGEYAVPVIFGPEWHEAGRYLQILTFMLLGQFIASPLSQTLNLLQKQHTQFLWDLSRVLLVVGTFVAAKYFAFSASVAVLLYSAAMLVSYVALFFLSRNALASLPNRE